ncbi:hypothetical protein GGI19_003758 [Coemansia pectinata]|uniref:SAM-dependent MTase RsmB/NOP-type domain-containing protein n=1 Tax=Coemansia pectinata TaxID=1052879 RepID=A0A9W8LAM7_9FUNG|nr:hypothetical protein GGI19_003758 [Coemansia pectinata]
MANAEPVGNTTATATLPLLPPSFCAFLRDNHIDAEVYNTSRQLPRYVRIIRYHQRSKHYIDELVQQIQADAGCKVSKVDSVPGFIEIADQAIRLSQISAYNNGDIVGMDVSSGIAALAMSVEPGDNVLDLCCAPGAKLLLLADLLDNHRSNTSAIQRGTVTGVDISPHRAATCRSLVKKHAGNDRGFIRVFVDDGTTFDCKAPQHGWHDPQAVKAASASVNSPSSSSDSSVPKAKRQKQAVSGQPWFAPKLLSTAYACSGTQLYDRVLVDAECTHDGSLVHVQKYAQWGWDQLDTQVVDGNKSVTVPILQSKLLENGWRLLKPGSVLVYSTCSLSRYQNEFVLGGFLARHAEDEAVLEPIPLLAGSGAIVTSPIWTPVDDDEWDRAGLSQRRSVFSRMRHAVRLNPLVSNTSGMFIARIKKLQHGAQLEESEIVPLALPPSTQQCTPQPI